MAAEKTLKIYINDLETKLELLAKESEHTQIALSIAKQAYTLPFVKENIPPSKLEKREKPKKKNIPDKGITKMSLPAAIYQLLLDQGKPCTTGELRASILQGGKYGKYVPLNRLSTALLSLVKRNKITKVGRALWVVKNQAETPEG